MKARVVWFSALIVLSSIAKVSLGATFGNNGMSGHDGYDGQPGRNGRTITFVADGTAQTYQIHGSDGEDGRDGYHGSDAMGCSQPMNVDYDLEGADGGRAGRGGNGGNGGNGGDITVHFDQVDNLKKVYVQAFGGEGGRPGRGSQGGRACYCSLTTWTVTNGTSTSTHYCRNGQDGQWGNEGNQGNRGYYGKVTLISQLTPVLASKPQATVKMEELETAIVDLSANNWETRKGARSLFALGSEISDTFNYYAGRTEVKMGFAWKANRPLTDFTGRKMNLELQNGKVVKYFPSDLWVKGDETAEADKKLYTISNALFTKQIFDLSIGGLVGVGKNLVVQVTDKGNVSDQVTTTLTAEYFTVYNGFWYKRFSGAVAPELVSVNSAGLTIALGQLAIDEKYLADKTRAFVRLYAKRSLGNYYSTKEITKDQTLKP